VEGEISKAEPSSSQDLSTDKVGRKELKTDQSANPEILGEDSSGELVFQSYGFTGPIPPPGILAGYDKALPNGADRVMKMAEREQEHRHKMEDTIVGKESFEKRAGLVFAFSLSTLTLLLSAYLLIFTEKSGPGLTLFILEFAALAGAFLGARNRQEREEAEDAEG
jgi:uncharacterized membrane protein